MNKKYIVRLTDEERAICEATVKKETGKSQKLRRATILLKADADGPAWIDGKIKRGFDGYAQWARSHNSLLIVTFDESGHDRDNHIATFAVGQRVVPGPIAKRADHYRLLRTLEDLYGLPPLGHSAQASASGGLWRAES